MQFSPQVEEAIQQAAARYGVPVEAMRAEAQIESGGNPAEQNSTSSAGGLFQFTNGTAKQYGLTNKFDPYASSDAAARLMKDNYQGLSSALGRAPTPGELYLAHQQGLGGATKLLTNPNAPAAQMVGAQAVNGNAGNPNMTAGQFANQWVAKADNLAGGGAAVNLTTGAMPGAATQGIASLTPTAMSAIPTVAAAGATKPDTSGDPMSGIFSLLAAPQQQQAPMVVMPQPMKRMADNRTPDEKMAATSETPNVYLERLRQENG